MAERENTGLRRRIYEILEVAESGDKASRWCDYALIVLILINIIAVILETVPPIQQAYDDVFDKLELISVGIFTIEYGLRVWTAVERVGQRRVPALKSRFRYLMSPVAIIDLLAILPFYLSFIIAVDLRFLRVLRLLRVFKLTRYSAAMTMLLNVFREEASSFYAAFFVLIIVLILASSGIYLFEQDAQPEAFGSIPHAMWWAMATLTTVGYGDVTPITPFGKLFGACITIVGIGMVALPAGILASGFADQLRRRREALEREFQIALEDGIIDEDEERALEVRRQELGVSSDAAEDIRRSATKRSGTPNTSNSCPHCGRSISRRAMDS
ncbi:ion transporter [Pelagibius sp. Alg239-R121]|uniref:ion transporter n=1 Tax=Pelagibius sp. Alg239-R121 TaxID=2993448 RepID=UPI0024A794CA|nr:ion transporter [Pelagibius sp. Alg239-R121]